MTPRASDGSPSATVGLFAQADKDGDRDGYASVDEVTALNLRFDGNGDGILGPLEGARLIHMAATMW